MLGWWCACLLRAPAPNPDHLLAPTSKNSVPWPYLTAREAGKCSTPSPQKNGRVDIGRHECGQASRVFQFQEHIELLLYSGANVPPVLPEMFWLPACPFSLNATCSERPILTTPGKMGPSSLSFQPSFVSCQATVTSFSHFLLFVSFPQ